MMILKNKSVKNFQINILPDLSSSSLLIKEILGSFHEQQRREMSVGVIQPQTFSLKGKRWVNLRNVQMSTEHF